MKAVLNTNLFNFKEAQNNSGWLKEIRGDHCHQLRALILGRTGRRYTKNRKESDHGQQEIRGYHCNNNRAF